jgi:hypothetical protein
MLNAFVLYLIIKLLISPLAFSMVQIKMSSRSADITLTSPKYPLTRTLIKLLIVRKHCQNSTSQLKSIFLQLKNMIAAVHMFHTMMDLLTEDKGIWPAWSTW